MWGIELSELVMYIGSLLLVVGFLSLRLSVSADELGELYEKDAKDPAAAEYWQEIRSSAISQAILAPTLFYGGILILIFWLNDFELRLRHLDTMLLVLTVGSSHGWYLYARATRFDQVDHVSAREMCDSTWKPDCISTVTVVGAILLTTSRHALYLSNVLLLLSCGAFTWWLLDSYLADKADRSTRDQTDLFVAAILAAFGVYAAFPLVDIIFQGDAGYLAPERLVTAALVIPAIVLLGSILPGHRP